MTKLVSSLPRQMKFPTLGEVVDFFYSLQFDSAIVLNHRRCSDQRKLGKMAVQFASPGIFVLLSKHVQKVSLVMHPILR